jgi:pimeloyl-ACP methyl ester carboxylesterase
MLHCLAGCSSTPEAYDRKAEQLGIQRQDVAGLGYRHAVYRKKGEEQAQGPMHVYLYGDGRPWMRRHIPAPDPTPQTPLMLQLMTLDPAPGLLLGRPCYHGHAQEPNCDRSLWTSHRYAERVLASMRVALRRANPKQRPVILIGHSGGGALAMLLAPRVPEVVGVLTLAGNLDIDAWSRYRRITPLTGSLNPAKEVSNWCPACLHLHFAGGDDKQLPASLIDQALEKMGEPAAAVVHGVTHDRGWLERWPEILRQLESKAPGPSLRRLDASPE